MVFTDVGQATAWLESMVSPGTTPTLPDGAVMAALDASRVVDADGRAPVDSEYVPTWNGWYAAALLLEQKAAIATVTRTGGVQSFTSEGSSVTRTEGTTAVQFQALADQYRARAFPSGPVSVIDLGSTLGPAPRSAFEGVTADDHRW